MCFESSIPVVRMTASKGKKAKELLIAAGKDLRVRKGYRFEIYKHTEERIGNKMIQRKAGVGLGVIMNVEDENFSILEVNSGEEEVLLEIRKGTELFCRAINK